jgi:dethiobiotin synthetase
MTALFITATGTGIGKTFLTELLLRQAGAHGMKARALKPVASGYDPGDAESDTARLLAAQALPAARAAEISLYRLAAPLSPDMAAAREGVSVDLAPLLAFCQPRSDELLLIEGVGGVMVPLNARATVLDWIDAMACPAILVAGSYLGTLSHTLTAAAALASRGIKVKAVIISESLESPVPLIETASTLASHLPATRILCLSRTGQPPDLVSALLL